MDHLPAVLRLLLGTWTAQDSISYHHVLSKLCASPPSGPGVRVKGLYTRAVLLTTTIQSLERQSRSGSAEEFPLSVLTGLSLRI
jgi:hypothetical protein